MMLFKNLQMKMHPKKLRLKNVWLMDVEIFQVTLCILQWQHFCYFITQM